MSTLSSANVTDVNLVLKERTHMRSCLNMLIFRHNLGNWLISDRLCDWLSFSYADDCGPVMVDCDCYTCQTHTRAYLHHLLNTSELLASVLLMMWVTNTQTDWWTDTQTDRHITQQYSHMQHTDRLTDRHTDRRTHYTTVLTHATDRQTDGQTHRQTDTLQNSTHKHEGVSTSPVEHLRAAGLGGIFGKAGTMPPQWRNSYKFLLCYYVVLLVVLPSDIEEGDDWWLKKGCQQFGCQVGHIGRQIGPLQYRNSVYSLSGPLCCLQCNSSTHRCINRQTCWNTTQRTINK